MTITPNTIALIIMLAKRLRKWQKARNMKRAQPIAIRLQTALDTIAKEGTQV